MKQHRFVQSALCLAVWAASFQFGGAQLAPSGMPQAPDSRLIFQTAHGWSPRININADTVMVYGIDETTAARIQSWKEHGYHVDLMTGVAWGRYAPYLRGDFDGKQHWNETQQEKNGNLILHGGREIPYVAPSLSYGQYLAQGVQQALDAGAEAIYLEEPEFWARAGWSESFRHEWQEYYHEAWQEPDHSPDAQYRASKLKYFLYRRALAQVFDAVRTYGNNHHRVIPCYVATHSLINYAQWRIVSPESSLLQVGADGYIAQVWTGTAREPNTYEGVTQERTFETAFLEYGALQNIARSSGKRIWYLDDPIEDNRHHSWTDYRKNWESTLVAALLQPEVTRYEVLPWPERIFGPDSRYPSREPSASAPEPEETLIPAAYETELQTVFHALGEMPKHDANTRWEIVGTQDIGVLVADTLMFQRSGPETSDERLGEFYGLAMPLLMRGIPVEPVQIENFGRETSTAAPAHYKVLFLTYDGQKPPAPEFHDALARWVRSGGALIVLDDDKDPYNHAKDWWNSGNNHFNTPREDLFQKLGIAATAPGVHAVGKGYVLYEPNNPAALATSPSGADVVRDLFKTALQTIHQPLVETDALVLRRGPYVIAAGLDDVAGDARQPSAQPVIVHGDFIDLFDAQLAEKKSISIEHGTRAFLLDVNDFKAAAPRILAASGKITNEHATGNSLSFQMEGIDQTQAIVRILCPKSPRQVMLNHQPMEAGKYEYAGRSLTVHFVNAAHPQELQVLFE